MMMGYDGTRSYDDGNGTNDGTRSYDDGNDGSNDGMGPMMGPDPMMMG